MTQTRDLIKKMADFFTGEEFYEKGEDARLELSPDDVRCMNEVIKACGNAISRQVIKEQIIKYGFHAPDMTVTEFVEDLPSIKPQEPKTGWIPIEWKPFGKNGYPKPEDEYKHFLTIDDKGEITIQEFLLTLDEEPQPYFTGMRNIIAWMSLPSPYEPQNVIKRKAGTPREDYTPLYNCENWIP